MPTVFSRASETLYAVRLFLAEVVSRPGHMPDVDVSTVFMAYHDRVVHLPEGFVTIGSTKSAEFAAIAHQSKPIFGSSLLLSSGLAWTSFPKLTGITGRDPVSPGGHLYRAGD